MYWFGKAAMALTSAKRFKETAQVVVENAGKAKNYLSQFHKMEFGASYNYAKQGDPDAQFDIAERYYKGRGVEKSLDDAVVWYQRAANAGHDRAQCTLAMLVFIGRGVDPDPAEAWKWMRLALNQKDVRADELAPSIHKKLSPEQFYEGERRAKEHVPEKSVIQDPTDTAASDESPPDNAPNE